MDAPESIPLTTPKNRREADKLFAQINEIDAIIAPLAAIRNATKAGASAVSKAADKAYAEEAEPYEAAKEVLLQHLGEYALEHKDYLRKHFKQVVPLKNGEIKLNLIGKSLITDDADEDGLIDFLLSVPGGKQFIRKMYAPDRDAMKSAPPEWQLVFLQFGADVTRQLHVTVKTKAMKKAKTVYRLLFPSGTVRPEDAE